MFPRFSCTLRRTVASVWLGLAIRSRTDLTSIRMTHYVKQVQYVEPQEYHIFCASLSL